MFDCVPTGSEHFWNYTTSQPLRCILGDMISFVDYTLGSRQKNARCSHVCLSNRRVPYHHGCPDPMAETLWWLDPRIGWQRVVGQPMNIWRVRLVDVNGYRVTQTQRTDSWHGQRNHGWRPDAPFVFSLYGIVFRVCPSDVRRYIPFIFIMMIFWSVGESSALAAFMRRCAPSTAGRT